MKKLQGQQKLNGNFIKECPERVILLSDTLNEQFYWDVK